MAALGGDPARASPLRPAELIIDHSVVADYSGTNASHPRLRKPDITRGPSDGTADCHRRQGPLAAVAELPAHSVVQRRDAG